MKCKECESEMVCLGGTKDNKIGFGCPNCGNIQDDEPKSDFIKEILERSRMKNFEMMWRK